MTRWFIAVAFCFTAACVHSSENRSPLARSTEAMKIRAAGDLSKSDTALLSLADNYPNNPRLQLFAAEALERNKNVVAALERLEKIAEWNLGYELADFEQFRSEEPFENIATKFAKIRMPKGHVVETRKFKTSDLIVEGVAYSPQTEATYVTSLFQPRLVERQNSGSERVLNLDHIATSLLGLDIDDTTKTIWVCSKLTSGKSGVLDIDRDSLVLRKVHPILSDTETLCNDVSASGTVFISDSLTGRILLLTKSGNFESLYTDKDFFYPNGLAYVAEYNVLIVADQSGLWCVPPTGGITRPVDHSSNITLAGVDGIATKGNKLYAVQNGVEPIRIIVISIDFNSCSVSGFSVLASGLPSLPDPTTLFVEEEKLWIVANSQFNRVVDGALLDNGPIEEFALKAIQLHQ